MQLQTARLIIREFTYEDMDAVHAYASDPLVAKYMIWGPNSKEETRSYIGLTLEWQSQIPRKDFEFAVVLKETDQLIGGCGIHISEPGQGEIGYCFNPLFWRQGYTSEAAASLLEFGFEELNLHRIYATCRPENVGSAKVMQKLGMVYEGHLREHMWHKGRWHDSYQYSILKPEYERVKRLERTL
ncbi:GNAT family N-acetyltransferase [Paenibacillus graminis]|uniref:GCN5 family acetyltransferase n=1 Tax=Paenibacillus graminis TaxID=189425 RepID=A0A089MC43_9BACL|nr:GNAT family N-acetyltransferase [Paenibacillus graminis]AIQ70862.1 GCN5 family acetyltransferase [Paenibacillus graminis]